MVEHVTGAEVVSGERYAALQHDHVALEQQFAAANEVLSALGRFSGDPDQVLQTILDSAAACAGPMRRSCHFSMMGSTG